MITIPQLEDFREQLPEMKVLVVGDLMLDRYLWGRVTRISPEAPVPIIDVTKVENRPGGAANVALNLAAMGASVQLAGVVGTDSEGVTLRELLEQHKFDHELVIQDGLRPTTTKTRLIGNQQQMMRVDQEERGQVSATLQMELADRLIQQTQQPHVIVFEDYDKGVLGAEMIQKLISWANEQNIPTVVDPKFRNFFAYAEATVFKPNLKELNEGMKEQVARNDFDGISKLVGSLREQMPHRHTLVTLSEYGVISFDDNLKQDHHAAHFRKITDVSGAGDTVIALVGLALAAGWSVSDAAYLANLGGGLVCEEVGVVPIDRDRLFKEMQILIG